MCKLCPDCKEELVEVYSGMFICPNPNCGYEEDDWDEEE